MAIKLSTANLFPYSVSEEVRKGKDGEYTYKNFSIAIKRGEYIYYRNAAHGGCLGKAINMKALIAALKEQAAAGDIPDELNVTDNTRWVRVAAEVQPKDSVERVVSNITL